MEKIAMMEIIFVYRLPFTVYRSEKNLGKSEVESVASCQWPGSSDRKAKPHIVPWTSDIAPRRSTQWPVASGQVPVT